MKTDGRDAPRERQTDPMDNWLMKPALEWLEQAEHGENKSRCRGIAALLRDLWRQSLSSEMEPTCAPSATAATKAPLTWAERHQLNKDIEDVFSVAYEAEWAAHCRRGPIGNPNDMTRTEAQQAGLLAVYLMGQRRAALAAAPSSPVEEGPMIQYYYKTTGCKAEHPKDPDCICWHDKGTGPLTSGWYKLTSLRIKPNALRMKRSQP